MQPTKQEKYDASRDAFDTKSVYIAITELQRRQQEFMSYVTALEKAAYAAARALEAEQEKSARLEAQLLVAGRACADTAESRHDSNPRMAAPDKG